MHNEEIFERMYSDLMDNPHWLFIRYEIPENYCEFVNVDDTVYSASLFLDHRLEVNSPARKRIELIALLDRFSRKKVSHRAANYIFHIGHCGSTMISRLLGCFEGVLALREPVPLISLAENYRKIGEPPLRVNANQYSILESFVVHLVTRTFNEQQTALIKPTSYCYNIADRLMNYNKGSKSVMLYINLETYLATMLRASQRKAEALNAAQNCLSDLKNISCIDYPVIENLPVEKTIALNWIAHMTWLIRLTQNKSFNGRIGLVNFDDFLSNPAESLQSICTLFDIQANAGEIKTVINGPIMQSYSKKPEIDYNSDTRRRELAQYRQIYSREISSTLAWAEKLCTEQPILNDVAGYIRVNA